MPAIWQSRIVNGISVVLCLGSLTYLISGMLNLSHSVQKILQQTNLQWYATFSSDWSIVLLSLLSLLLLVYYMHLRYVIDKFFSVVLRAEKRRINILFLTFLIAYFLRTVVSICLYIEPTGWVC